MGELDLDKIERTYTMPSYKKHELKSIRIATGTMRPKHTSVIRRDLTAASRKTKNNAATR